MAQASGNNAQLLIVQEVDFGVTPATPSMQVLTGAKYGESLKTEYKSVESQAITPKRGVLNTRNTLKNGSGSVPFELPINGSGITFKGLLGSVTTTGPDVNGKYTHVIKRAAILKSFSLQKWFNDISKSVVYSGCKFDKLSLSAQPDGLAEGSFDLIFKDETTGTALLDATPIEYAHNPFANFECSVEEGGVAKEFYNISFEITNGLDGNKFTVGNRTVKEIPLGKSGATGSVVMAVEDLSYIGMIANETETSLKMTYTNGNDSFEVYFPRIKFTGTADPVISSEGGLDVTLNFTALVDDTEDTDVIVTIINDEVTI